MHNIVCFLEQTVWDVCLGLPTITIRSRYWSLACMAITFQMASQRQWLPSMGHGYKSEQETEEEIVLLVHPKDGESVLSPFESPIAVKSLALVLDMSIYKFVYLVDLNCIHKHIKE